MAINSNHFKVFRLAFRGVFNRQTFLLFGIPKHIGNEALRHSALHLRSSLEELLRDAS